MQAWMKQASWSFPSLSKLVRANDNRVVETSPERYLELAKECASTVYITVQTSPENDHFELELAEECMINQELCQYLASKLLNAIQNAEKQAQTYLPKFIERAHPGTFKLLFRLAKEVQSFIRACFNDQWIQHAIMFTNMSEYVSSLAYELEFCTGIMRNPREFASSAMNELASRREAKAKTVRLHALSDQHRLLDKVNALIETSNPSTIECQLAFYLLGRLTPADPADPAMPIPGSIGSSSSSFWEVDYGNLEQLEKLGTGGAGVVHKTEWLGELVAEKTFFGSDHPSFRTEVSILAGLSHPNIVPMFCYAMDNRRCSIVMELMEGDLYSLMQSRLRRDRTLDSPFTIPEAVDIILHVADGVNYLHEKKVVHRDLKSQNILVKSANDVEYVYVKVADFGLSKTKERSCTFSNQTLNTGTTRWMAPELMTPSAGDHYQAITSTSEKVKYPFMSDVYSFAMVCYEILSGAVPFYWTSSHRDVRTMVLDGERPELPDLCPDYLKTLIQNCWQSDASARPTFNVICAELRSLKCSLLTGIDVRLCCTHEQPRMRKKIELRLRAGFNKRTLEIRPPKFKKKLWFGTYTEEEIDRATDAVNHYMGYNQPYNYPDSQQIFAAKPLKGIKFEDLQPTCDQVIRVGDEQELAYKYFTRQVKEVIHSVMGKQKKSLPKKYKSKVQSLLNEAPQELDIFDPTVPSASGSTTSSDAHLVVCNPSPAPSSLPPARMVAYHED